MYHEFNWVIIGRLINFKDGEVFDAGQGQIMILCVFKLNTFVVLQLKHMEGQMEEEYEDKKRLQTEKRDIESKLQEVNSHKSTRDKGQSDRCQTGG